MNPAPTVQPRVHEASLSTAEITAHLATFHLVGQPVSVLGAWDVAVSFQDRDDVDGTMYDLRLADGAFLPREPHCKSDETPYFLGYQATISLSTDIQPGDQAWVRTGPSVFVVVEMMPDRAYRALHNGELLGTVDVIGRLESVSRFFSRKQRQEREGHPPAPYEGITYLAGDPLGAIRGCYPTRRLAAEAPTPSR